MTSDSGAAPRQERRPRSGLARALSHRNLRLYIAGQSVSLIGLWVHRVALGWLVWELTGSAAWLGIIAFVDLAPGVVLGPLAGAIADRFDRRRLAFVFQYAAMALTLSLAALTIGDMIDIWLLLLFTLALGTATAFWQPARLSLIPSLVPREDLGTAIALTSITFNVARFIGPAVAGPIILWAGVGEAFAVNGLSFLSFIVALTFIKLPSRQGDGSRRASLFIDAARGISYAARHPGIGPLLLMMTVYSLTLRPLGELLPAVAEAIFSRGPAGLATMTSAMGVGALVAGSYMAWRGARTGLIILVLIAIGLAAAATFAVAAAPWFALAVGCLAVLGLCESLMGIGSQTLLQMAVDEAMRGRVVSLYGMIIRGGPAVGALAIGTASEFAGLRLPIAMAAIVALAAAGTGFALRHRWAGALETASPVEPRRRKDERDA